MINKKAQGAIGSGLTLFVVFFLLFIMVSVYIVWVGEIKGKSFLGDEEEKIIVSSSQNDPVFVGYYLSFLEKSVRFDDKDILVKDLIFDEKGLRKFEELGDEFIYKNIRVGDNAWIRVYDIGEREYFAKTKYSTDLLCGLENQKDFVFKILNNGRKIILCVRYNE